MPEIHPTTIHGNKYGLCGGYVGERSGGVWGGVDGCHHDVLFVTFGFVHAKPNRNNTTQNTHHTQQQHTKYTHTIPLPYLDANAPPSPHSTCPSLKCLHGSAKTPPKKGPMIPPRPHARERYPIAVACPSALHDSPMMVLRALCVCMMYRYVWMCR